MYFAAIHLFTRSKTKSKISFSPVKKLVAATAVLATSYIIINFIAKRPAYTQRNLRGCFDDMRRKLIFYCASVCYIIHFTNNKEPAIPILS